MIKRKKNGFLQESKHFDFPDCGLENVVTEARMLEFEYSVSSFYREQQSPLTRVTYDLNYPRAQH